MPRTKTVTDDELLDGVERVLHERGPHGFTLADVSRETGLSPATLLQRFGSKRALLVAFARRAASRTAVAFADEKPGLAALRRGLANLAKPLDDRRRMTNSLALLLEDVRDPALAAAARAQAEALESTLEHHVAAAIRARELATDEPRALARAIQTAWNGAMILWAIRGRGSLGAWVLAAVDAVLAPYRRKSR